MPSNRLPRDLNADRFVRALAHLGYSPIRQTGSHIRVSTQRDGEHHETIPNHSPLKVGTLNAILKGIGAHHGMSREELLALLDL